MRDFTTHRHVTRQDQRVAFGYCESKRRYEVRLNGRAIFAGDERACDARFTFEDRERQCKRVTRGRGEHSAGVQC